MRRKSLGSMRCSIAQTLDVVGDPWTLLIVRDAMFGRRRFDEFVESLGIPRNTLTQRLVTLTEAGVLARQEYQAAPPRYEYVLTTKGWALRDVIVALLQWGDEYSPLPEPPVVLHDATTGAPLHLAYVDAATGRRLADIDVERRRPDGQPID